MNRGLVVLLLVGLALTGCSGSADDVSSISVEDPSPSTTMVTTTAAPTMPASTAPVGADVLFLRSVDGLDAAQLGESKLAYVDSGIVYLLAPGDTPYRVGVGDDVVWSIDGRYLAWRSPRDGWVSDPWLNVPRPYDVAVLDTETGDRAEYIAADPGLSGQVLGVDGGFIAAINGDRNFAATSFVHIEPQLLFIGSVPVPIEARFEDLTSFDEQPAITHYDFNWADSDATTAYVVVTEASTTWYRYNPQIWRVSLQGAATRLSDGCVDECFNNAGFYPFAVSPDEDMIFVDDAIRNGCQVLNKPTLIDLNRDTRISLSSLPNSPAEQQYSVLRVRSVDWTSADTFIAAIARIELPQDVDERCTDPVLVPSQLYECDTTGTCEPLGIETSLAAASSQGDLAYATSQASGGTSKLVLVQWADGSTTSIIVQHTMAWAP